MVTTSAGAVVGRADGVVFAAGATAPVTVRIDLDHGQTAEGGWL